MRSNSKPFLIGIVVLVSVAELAWDLPAQCLVEYTDTPGWARHDRQVEKENRGHRQPELSQVSLQ